ncbi:MAG: hypothetical protein K0S86_1681 [Geminicoccaceae bacterium]|nr:hypothetical protein [Geminicoccaceae bacterium]
MRALVLLLTFVALLVGVPGAVAAQASLLRPALDWMTVRTRFFEIHYPAPMAEWTLNLASRIDAVRDAVSAFVGYAPPHRVTILVEDPLNQSNGFANVPLDRPFIVLWPTPPDPSGMLGSYRDWSELLAVHEFAHVAHLVRPTRNPGEQRFWQWMPIRLGPITRRAPRWAVEGYATYVEGRLTGLGRPHGASRAAYLRQWALEGRLPTYSQLSSSNEFAGGAMAYLAGSAFFEWLAEQRGESSVVAVWRRLSAREPRSFAQAFAGVYASPPDELYGRFTVELTRRAVAVRDTLASAGLDTGTLVQRRRWSTGEPAVSRDGRFMAVALPNRTTPGPLVVWRTEERADTARERRARERLLRLDPEDVPAVAGEPRRKTAIATLRPMRGRGFHSPRFYADSSRLLVAHDDPLGDGAYRTDLYEWRYRSGALRRITTGAGVQDAAPLPDGRSAVAVRCENGLCDLVMVDLASGALTTVRRGRLEAPFHRPRVSPDGRSVVVSVQQAGRWRLALIPLAPSAADGNGTMMFVDPDDGASRYHPDFLPDGRSLVCVSEAGGVPNLEILDIEHPAPNRGAPPRALPLTRLTGAVFAPAVNAADTSVFFLALHSRGLDVRRIAVPPPDSVGVMGSVRPALPQTLAPAIPVATFRADTFTRARPAEPRAYGAGPRRHRLLPGGNYSSEGGFVSASLIGADPVGRFTYVLTGGIGERSAWRGGSLVASWRGSRAVVAGVTSIDGTLFGAEQRPSAQRTVGDAAAPVAAALDARQIGATLGTTTSRDFGQARLAARVGANLSRLELFADPNADDAVRGLAFGELRGVMRLRRGGYRADLALGVHGARGSTEGRRWARAIGSLATDVGTPFGSGRLDATLGGTGGAGLFERFAIGGWPSPFVDPPVLSQRIPMPALPAGFAIGRRVATARAAVALGPLRPFYWIGSTTDDLDRWARVAGLDADFAVNAFPAFALPAIAVRAGAAYSWDEPFRHRVGAYVGVTYRP